MRKIWALLSGLALTGIVAASPVSAQTQIPGEPISIGAVPNATQLYVFLGEDNPPTGTRSFLSEHQPVFTANSNTTPHSNDFWSFPVVNNGVTFSGSFKAHVLEHLRNFTGANDSGSMSGEFISSYHLYGHSNINGTATPQTYIVKGLELYPVHKSGTISNLFDLFIAAGEGGGVVGSHTAIYQEDASAQNIFNGRVGVNESNGGWPTNAQFAVTSAINAGTFYNNGSVGWAIGSRVNSTGAYLMDLHYGGTQVGSITTNGTAASYNTTSDIRLKANIADAGETGKIIDALRVRSWTWRSTGAREPFGFVAQEEYKVFPAAVTPGDNGKTIQRQWSRDDSKLVPLLVKEVQSLRSRVAKLETKH